MCVLDPVWAVYYDGHLQGKISSPDRETAWEYAMRTWGWIPPRKAHIVKIKAGRRSR